MQDTIERHVARIHGSHAIALVSRYAEDIHFLFDFFVGQLFRVPVHVVLGRNVPKTFPSFLASY